MTSRFSAIRRRFLTRTGGLFASGWIGKPPHAQSELLAAHSAASEAMARFSGGVQPEPGKIELTLPDIAENGNSVSVSIRVQSPMSEENHVDSVAIVAPANPTPLVANFHFTPASGEAFVATRIRLARTQTVVALARMSNGRVYSNARNVIVTIGGCGADHDQP